jgi:hypothetical protein
MPTTFPFSSVNGWNTKSSRRSSSSPSAHWLAASVDMVEQAEEVLVLQFGKGLPHRFPNEIAPPDQPHVGFVDHLQDVFGAVGDGHEAGRLVEQLSPTIAIGGGHRAA